MAVALDALSTGGDGALGHMNFVNFHTTTSSQAAFLTAGASATFLWVGILIESNSPGTIAFNWDSTGTNQPMTLIGALQSTGGTPSPPCSIAIFGLVNPTSGNKTISWSATGVGAGVGGYIVGATWTGTATASVAATTEGFAGANDGGVQSTPATVTTASTIPTGDAVAAMFGVASLGFDGTFSAGATEIDTDGSGSHGGGAARWSGAGAAVTASANISGGDGNWAAVAVGLKAAASGDTLGSSMQMLVM